MLFYFHLYNVIGFSENVYLFFSSFLNQCRLMSVSMGNAVKHLKHHITHMPNNLKDHEVSVLICIFSGILYTWMYFTAVYLFH